MDSIRWAGQIAPQRSTQYSSLTRDLAPLELQALSEDFSGLELLQWGGIDYVAFATPGNESWPADPAQLSTLATFSGFFRVLEEAETRDVLLKPLPRAYDYFIAPDMAYTRRYKGKTNEIFTQLLLNLAKFASDYKHTSWRQLRVCDPLCGGGTTLFLALALGADVGGVEREIKDAESTAVFVEQYAAENRIPLKCHAERLKDSHKGRRWLFQLEKTGSKKLILASGDTKEASHLLAGLGRVHLVVADLPYGVQHYGPVRQLITEALPVWAAMLKPGGVVAFSWDATRLPREEMIPWVEASGLAVVDRPPYNRLVHRVDRVIKRRDIIVAKAREERVPA